MEPSDAVVTYQWLADGAVIDGADDDTLLVTDLMVGQAISVTVTTEDGEEATSDETDLVTADKSFDVKLVDNSGLQADGTALLGDTLGLTYGAEFGTISAITWYVNGAVIDVSVPGAALNLTPTTNTRDWIGEVYAIVENTDKERAKTNTLTVTDVEQPIEVSGIEIIDDYATPTLSYAPKDANAVLTVTMSKKVDGDLYIYKESTTKYGNGNNTFKITKADFANATVKKNKASELTAKNAVEAAATTNSCTGMYFQDSDGSTTYMIKLDDPGMAATIALAAIQPVRGTTYKAVFDQANISTDDIGATTRADVEVSDPFTAPYITAPESIALTSHSAGSVPQITFYDGEGEVLTWFGNPKATTVNTRGITNVTTYGETGSTKAKDKKDAQGITANLSSLEKGVLTGDTPLRAGSTYFWATVTTDKGIFGAKAVTLESAIVEGAELPYETMNLVDDSTNPKDAVVTFTKLKTPGTVYVLQGTGEGSTASGIAAFDADDVATYVGKADVEKGDTKVVLSDVLESFADSATTGRYYTAYFVPDNTEDYSIAYPTTYQNTQQTVKSATVSNNLILAQVPTSIKYDETGTAETVTRLAVGTAPDSTTSDQKSDTLTGGKLVAYDQFGDKMANTAALAAKTATVTVNNSTLTTTEAGSAKYIIDANGAVEIDLYRMAEVDKGDGFTVKVLGSDVKFATKYAIANSTATADTTVWKVTMGGDTIASAAYAQTLTVGNCKATATQATAGGAITIVVSLKDQFGNDMETDETPDSATITVTNVATGAGTDADWTAKTLINTNTSTDTIVVNSTATKKVMAADNGFTVAVGGKYTVTVTHTGNIIFGTTSATAFTCTVS